MITALQTPAAETASSQNSREALQYTPRFDIVETPEELTLYGDLPGVQPSDVEIRFENRELVVHGKVAPRNTSATRRCAQEYGIGDFYRTFAISEGFDAHRIQAELKNGVLILHLPKAEAVKPRRIRVNAG